MAHGLHAPVKLLPDAVRHFPQLRHSETAISLNGELAYEVSADAVFPITMRRSCFPELLLYLERTRAPRSHFTIWRSPEVRDYFLLNAELLPTELSHMAQQRAQMIEELSTVPAFVFHSSGTPQQSADEIRQFLASRNFLGAVQGRHIGAAQ